MEKRKCTKCNQSRLIKFFRNKLSNGKYYLCGNCKDCEYENTKKWRIENPEKTKALRRKYDYSKTSALKYRKKNREKLTLNFQKWYKNNKNLVLKKQTKTRKYNTKNLTDTYVIHSMISNGSILKAKQIREVPYLIEAKRIQLQLRRITNQ